VVKIEARYSSLVYYLSSYYWQSLKKIGGGPLKVFAGDGDVPWAIMAAVVAVGGTYYILRY
jgi:hypothetical protein